jgi:hypothetical protein
MNDAGQSVVDVEVNRPSVFLGRMTFLLSARMVGWCYMYAKQGNEKASVAFNVAYLNMPINC